MRLQWFYKLILVLLCGGILLFVAIEIVKWIDCLNSDFFSYWLAGHMTWTKQDIYSAEQWIGAHHYYGASWISDSTFIYPIPLAIIFVPLGLLSLNHAYIAWVFLSEVMIILSVLVLIFLHANPSRKHYIMPILAGVVLFRPTLITLFSGQVSGMLLLILTFVILLWGKEKWLFGSMLLSLVALKPNIGFPIIIILLLWLLVQKRVASLGGIVISGFALLFIGIVLDTNWIVEYLAIGNNKLTQTFGYSPTLWGLSAYISGFNLFSTIVLGGFATAILLTGVFYMVMRKQKVMTPSWSVSIAIITTLLVTPYTWPYDQLLLVIPIITIMMEMMRRKYPFLLTATAFLFLDLISFVLLEISAQIQMEVLNALIPLVIFCALVFCVLPMKDRALEPTSKKWDTDDES